jgi:hypothetical protein
MSKEFSADALLQKGRARTKPAQAQHAASRRLDVETSPHLDTPEQEPTERRYERLSAYITEDQRDWLKRSVVQTSTGRFEYSYSDFIRLGLELVGQLGPQELSQALAEQAWTEVDTYPGRAKRGMPPRPGSKR